MNELLDSFADHFWAKLSGREPKAPCSGSCTCFECWGDVKSRSWNVELFHDGIDLLDLRDPAKEPEPKIRYPPFSNDNAIRLLNVEPSTRLLAPLVCRFEELDLRNETGYSGFSALSYRWGDDEPIIPIQVDGQTLYVRRNLWDFLMQARANGWTSHLWIDAICINQADIAERNAQVSRMAEIYSRASHVLIWPGTLDQDENTALFELDMLVDEVQWRNWAGTPFQNLGSKFSERGRRGIVKMIRNPYWERKWIIQEIWLSTGTASFIVGATTLPIDRIRGCFVTARMLMASDLDFRSDSRRLNLLLPDDRSKLKTSSLRALVSKYKDHKCGDPRDHVYGILGLCDTARFDVDYAEEPAHLYWRAVERAFSDEKSENAREVRCFAALLKDIMGLSEERISRRWRELVNNGDMKGLWGYQFGEAMQLSLGELNEERAWPKMRVEKEYGQLPVVQLDYEKFRTRAANADDEASLIMASMALDLSENKDSNAVASKVIGHVERADTRKQWILSNALQIDALMSFFDLVRQNHLSALGSPEGMSFGPDLGDYFIGVVNNGSPVPGTDFKGQYREYEKGSRWIRFPLSEASCPFEYTVQGAAKIWRRSEVKHLIMEAGTSFASDSPLQQHDIVCSFSGHQAALVLRRVSDDTALCGLAIARFRSRSFKVFGQRSLQVYMRPHSILKVENWSSELGKPYLRFKQHCTCKPGQGGCI